MRSIIPTASTSPAAFPPRLGDHGSASTDSTPATTIPVAAPAAETPPPSLASLFDQARAAQAELASQPLPITNHHHRFLMNLFGG